MTGCRRSVRVVVALAAVLLAPRAAYAYIDPGTTSSLFALLGPRLAIFGAFVGYLLWPFRKVVLGIFRRGKPADDAPEPAAEPQQHAETE